MKIAGNNSQLERPAERRGFASTLVAGIYKRFALGLRGKAHSARRMELIETLQLGGKRQLMLVSCDGQNFLVGAGGDNVNGIVGIAPGPLAQPAPAVTRCTDAQRTQPTEALADASRCIQ